MDTGTGTLSPKSVQLVNALLQETPVREKVTSDFEHRDYNNVEIFSKTGRMKFGKYSWGGFGGFWNNLIKCYEQISFSDFVLRTWDALVVMTVGTESNEAVIHGLSREILMEGIHNKKYDWTIDRLFDVCRHLTKDGYWKTQGLSEGKSADRDHHYKGCPYSGQVEIEVERPKSPPMTLRVIDSVGDTFEILNARWIGGRR